MALMHLEFVNHCMSLPATPYCTCGFLWLSLDSLRAGTVTLFYVAPPTPSSHPPTIFLYTAWTELKLVFALCCCWLPNCVVLLCDVRTFAGPTGFTSAVPLRHHCGCYWQGCGRLSTVTDLLSCHCLLGKSFCCCVLGFCVTVTTTTISSGLEAKKTKHPCIVTF